jgi:hypothetical protein
MKICNLNEQFNKRMAAIKYPVAMACNVLEYK